MKLVIGRLKSVLCVLIFLTVYLPMDTLGSQGLDEQTETPLGDDQNSIQALISQTIERTSGEIQLLYGNADAEGRFGSANVIRLRGEQSSPWQTFLFVEVSNQIRTGALPGSRLATGLHPTLDFHLEQSTTPEEEVITSFTEDPLDLDVEAQLASGLLILIASLKIPSEFLVVPDRVAGSSPLSGFWLSPLSFSLDSRKMTSSNLILRQTIEDLCPQGDCTDLAQDSLEEAIEQFKEKGLQEEAEDLQKILDNGNIRIDPESANEAGGCTSSRGFDEATGSDIVFISPECLKGDVSCGITTHTIAQILEKDPQLSEDESIFRCVFIQLVTPLVDEISQESLREDQNQIRLGIKVFKALGVEDFVAPLEWCWLAASEYSGRDDQETIGKMKALRKREGEVARLLEDQAFLKQKEEKEQQLKELWENRDWETLEKLFGLQRGCFDPETPQLEARISGSTQGKVGERVELSLAIDAFGQTEAGERNQVRSFIIDFDDGIRETGGDFFFAEHPFDPIAFYKTTVNHVYQVPGTYIVQLDATDTAGGIIATATHTIRIADPFIVELSGPVEGEAGESLSFEAGARLEVGMESQTRVSSMTLDFGDGQSVSPTFAPQRRIELTLSHIYQQPDTYTLTLTVTDLQGKKKTAQHQVTIRPRKEAFVNIPHFEQEVEIVGTFTPVILAKAFIDSVAKGRSRTEKDLGGGACITLPVVGQVCEEGVMADKISGVHFELAPKDTEVDGMKSTALPDGIELDSQTGALVSFQEIGIETGTFKLLIRAIDTKDDRKLAELWMDLTVGPIIKITITPPSSDTPTSPSGSDGSNTSSGNNSSDNDTSTSSGGNTKNKPPVVNAGSDQSGTVPCTVISVVLVCKGSVTISFNGSGHDPDGNITKWEWNFGDGKTAVGPPQLSHTYNVEFTGSSTSFKACLTATDNDGAKDTACATVTIVGQNTGSNN